MSVNSGVDFGLTECFLSLVFSLFFLFQIGYQYLSVGALVEKTETRIDMTSHDSQYPWASLNLKRECTGFCSEKRIRTFRSKQALCKDDEKDVLVGICELDEHVCRDGTLPPLQTFTFIYSMLFKRLHF